MTDVQDFDNTLCAIAWLAPGANVDRSGMRLFDNWWERLATVARFAPLLLTVIGFALMRPLGYYWE